MRASVETDARGAPDYRSRWRVRAAVAGGPRRTRRVARGARGRLCCAPSPPRTATCEVFMIRKLLVVLLAALALPRRERGHFHRELWAPVRVQHRPRPIAARRPDDVRRDRSQRRVLRRTPRSAWATSRRTSTSTWTSTIDSSQGHRLAPYAGFGVGIDFQSVDRSGSQRDGSDTFVGGNVILVPACPRSRARSSSASCASASAIAVAQVLAGWNFRSGR